MDPFTISAIVGAGSSLLGGLMSNKSAQSAQERSISAQRSLQQMLMTGGAQMARNAKQAGLSPAFALGQSSTPAASAPASNFAPFDFSSLGDIASKRELMNLQNEQKEVAKAEITKTKAEANIANEKAKQEEINTENMRSKQGEFTRQHTKITLPDGSNLYDDAANEYLNAHPDFDPNKVEIVRGLTEGQRQARQTMEENDILSIERHGREDDVYTKFAENSYKRAEAGLQEKISKQKINDDEFLSAIRELPKQQLNDLIQEIKLKGLEYTYKQKLIEYQDMSNKQFSETSIGRLIDRLKDTDMSFGEKTLFTLTFIFNNLATFMRPR